MIFIRFLITSVITNITAFSQIFLQSRWTILLKISKPVIRTDPYVRQRISPIIAVCLPTLAFVQPDKSNINTLMDHLFRHEYARLVAVLRHLF
jgi:hypothetical protein